MLVWWGHVRNAEVQPETGKKIVERIKAGKLSLIALHSAHWSTPFVEAMNERTTRGRPGEACRRAARRRPTVTYVHPQAVPVPEAGRPADAVVREHRRTRTATSSGDDHLPVLRLPRLPRRRQAEPRHDAAAGPPDRQGHARDVRHAADGDVRRAVPRPDAGRRWSSRRGGTRASGSAAAASGTSARAGSSTSGRATRSTRSTSRRFR